MSKDKFYNKDGSLTAYSFGCGYLETYNPGHKHYFDAQNYVYIEAANMEISLYNIKFQLCGKYYKWIQREGLTNTRKTFRKIKSVINKIIAGKITESEAYQFIESFENYLRKIY